MSYTRHASDVARILMTNPDGTYNLNGDRVEEVDGYEVGGVDPDLAKATTQDEVAEHIFRLRQEVEGDIDLIRLGRWEDPETGIIHFDATVHLPHRKIALQVGHVWNQICIWDWAARDTIPCDQ